MLFEGSAVALVTPFNDNNELDYGVLKDLIDFQIENNTSAILINGTTGEAPSLAADEFEKLIEEANKNINKRVPLIVGTSSNNYNHCLRNSKKAEQLGADALLICNPYYNKGTEEGVYQFFKTIAENINIPIILYNVPSRTGANISITNIIRLSKIKNIIAIKEASGDIERSRQLVKYIDVYSGNDGDTKEIINLGGKGVISVLANIMPKETAEICLDVNKLETYKNLIDLLFIETNPTPIKKAMQLKGFTSMNLRLPMYEMKKENVSKLYTELKRWNSDIQKD